LPALGDLLLSASLSLAQVVLDRGNGKEHGGNQDKRENSKTTKDEYRMQDQKGVMGQAIPDPSEDHGHWNEEAHGQRDPSLRARCPSLPWHGQLMSSSGDAEL
jgi:hypothetical protein